jgi:hypothetical protein
MAPEHENFERILMTEAHDPEMIAVAGLKLPAPWVLLESSTFGGRYYYFNTMSLESEWSLPSSLFAARTALYKATGSGNAGAEQLMQGALTAAQNVAARIETRFGDASPSQPDADTAGLYTVLNGLGSGGYSNVLLARHTEQKDLVALKVLSKRLLKRPRDRDRLKNELRALTEIPSSPFIQRCFAAFESPSHVCFVTE